MAHTQLIIGAPGTVVRHMRFNWRWLLVAALVIALWILGLGAAFHYVEATAQNAVKDAPPFGWFESFYFTVINVTTVGFGDIYPRTYPGHWIAIANSVFGLMAFGWFVAVFTIALQPASSPTTEVKVVLDPALLLKLFEHFSRGPDERPTDRPRRRLIIELDE
ncbi:potassium channel family protein [Bradyrhizobium sp. SSUT112]|uniref:potassium channel family protein n=1 Tax=Bradyrhizobium sp. SSUT112 TaxID=3040604 RepID=UPI002448DD20|nr:potassium channel family protein [Bradyrhizobium sp. SSUT112]MDH2353332.1 potassium channel family protein [Bradyrhizobium sp. SSUT112]